MTRNYEFWYYGLNTALKFHWSL